MTILYVGLSVGIQNSNKFQLFNLGLRTTISQIILLAQGNFKHDLWNTFAFI